MGKTDRSKSDAQKRVYIAMVTAYKLRDFIINNVVPMDEKSKETAREAIQFAETEDSVSIDTFRVCSHEGSREMAVWLIEFLPGVESRKELASYIRAKFAGESVKHDVSNANSFHEALRKTAKELYLQWRGTK